ncbi:VanW family protein [Demequina sp. SYSU T00039]|uniref:VanW family protein n=1 Tax=Demequina lignilytica TaxID=3051663 RepID=A0AAW7M0T3_9MICO|nr:MULTISPECIES: VanW family protein [unclassified Demequina]MDN4477671.1 VanW family protein [Demequina sp. SYSU T00039-1]MDN4487978.1 VanW family protein [Demequina sp. SYSU T00039]MDN4490418.1 VanW family protein [Demequina sp. SYSU T00068]
MTRGEGGDRDTEVEPYLQESPEDDAVDVEARASRDDAGVGHDDPAEDQAPVDEDGPPAASGHWGRWVAFGLLVMVAGAYVVAAFYASARVPDGTRVLGVDIGGLQRAAAVAALEPAFAEVQDAPVTLTIDERGTLIDPTEAGLSADAAATVDSLLSFSLSPMRIMRAFSGAEVDVDPVTGVDRDALVAAVDAVADNLVAEPQDAVVTVSSTGAAVTPGVDGEGVDTEASADIVAEAWPVDAVEVVAAPLEPAVTTAEAEGFAADLNATTLAADVLMSGENGDATVTSEQMVENATVVAEEGELRLVIDGAPIAAELERADPALVSDPSAASFSFTSDHQLTVVDSTTGRAIDPDALGEAVVAAATSADRVGTLPYRDTEATVTSDDLGVDDFKEIVSTFSTPVPYDPIRTKNLARGAELITGTVVKPGERFDLTEVLSPINGENGFYQAGVIVNGIHTEGYGGGLSQVSTTAYNAGYFAGMDDIAHRPHSVYFQRYPAGRESTLFIGSINMVFENSTPYSLVMSAYIEDAKLTVEIWSTPYYTVKTSASARTNVTPITTVELDDPDCEAYPGGEDGFTITNTRERYVDGELVDRKSLTWTYRPDNAVKCV